MADENKRSVRETLFHMVREAMRDPLNLIEPVSGWDDIDESDNDVAALNKLSQKQDPVEFYIREFDKYYKIIFSDNVAPTKGVEYFKRGSNFIKDIIKLVIEKYNLLIVDAKVDEIDDYTSSMNADCKVTQLQCEEDIWTDTEKQYRYRINFIVEIKDTIEVSIKTQIYNKGVSLTFDSNGNPAYYPERAITVTKSDKACSADVQELNDGVDHFDALKKLSKRLESIDEKKRIFELLIEKDNEVEKYISSRINKAEELFRDRNTYKFDYNVIPLTVYLDKIRDKRVVYEFKDCYGETAKHTFTVDPTAEAMEFHCPHCKTLCSGENSAKFVVAKDKDGENVVACTACAEAVKYGVEQPRITYALKEYVVTAMSNGTGGRYHLRDTFVDALDSASNYAHDRSRIRYHKSEERTPDYIYLPGRVHTNDKKFVTTEAKLYRCDNCETTYGIPSKMTNEFFSEHVYTADNNGEEVYCCEYCVNKTREEVPSIKNEILVSEDTGLLFVDANNACTCESCGKHIDLRGAKTCSVCKKVACRDCINDVTGMCEECQSADAERNRQPDEAKLKQIMAQIRSNIPLFASPRVVYEELGENELVRVFGRKMVYLFKLIDGKYVFSNKGEI